MLRMDSGSKCTWYKFIKGEQKQSYLLGDASDRRKDNSALMYCWTPEEHIGNNYLTCAPTLLLVEDKSLIWCVSSHFWFPSSVSPCACGETRREDITREMFQPDTEMSHCLDTVKHVCCVSQTPHSWIQSLSCIDSEIRSLDHLHRN